MPFTYAGRYQELFFLNGRIASNLDVKVETIVGGDAVLFSDRNKTATLPSPVVTVDQAGNLAFWADPGLYNLVVGATTVPSVEVNVDPSEVASGASFVDLTSTQVVGGAKTFTSLAGFDSGIDLRGSPSGYSGELRFPVGTASAVLGISTASTGSPELNLDHRGTGNTGKWQFRNGTEAGTTQVSISGSGDLIAIGPDHKFGAGANGGSGTFIHLGSMGNAGNAFVLAKGSAADVGLVLRTKGAGSLLFQDDTNVSRMIIANNGTNWHFGDMYVTGANNRFGVGANGDAGIFVRLSAASDANAYALAEGTLADIHFRLRSKGTGGVYLETGAGVVLGRFAAGSGSETSLNINLATIGERNVAYGAPDSAGVGYRTIRVAN